MNAMNFYHVVQILVIHHVTCLVPRDAKRCQDSPRIAPVDLISWKC